MNTRIEKIDRVRAGFDELIMAIPGVVSVASGLGENGAPCLQIGTSVAVDKIRPLLPAELAEIPVEITFIGEIKAQ